MRLSVKFRDLKVTAIDNSCEEKYVYQWFANLPADAEIYFDFDYIDRTDQLKLRGHGCRYLIDKSKDCATRVVTPS